MSTARFLDGETDGFARVHYDKKTGKILGGTIVARHAGEMIGELTLAIGRQAEHRCAIFDHSSVSDAGRGVAQNRRRLHANEADADGEKDFRKMAGVAAIRRIVRSEG